MSRRRQATTSFTYTNFQAMGQAKRRKQQLGDLYGTPEGSNNPFVVCQGFDQDRLDKKSTANIKTRFLMVWIDAHHPASSPYWHPDGPGASPAVQRLLHEAEKAGCRCFIYRTPSGGWLICIVLPEAKSVAFAHAIGRVLVTTAGMELGSGRCELTHFNGEIGDLRTLLTYFKGETSDLRTLLAMVSTTPGDPTNAR